MPCRHDYAYTQGYFYCRKCGRRSDNPDRGRGRAVAAGALLGAVAVFGILLFAGIIDRAEIAEYVGYVQLFADALYGLSTESIALVSDAVDAQDAVPDSGPPEMPVQSQPGTTAPDQPEPAIPAPAVQKPHEEPAGQPAPLGSTRVRAEPQENPPLVDPNAILAGRPAADKPKAPLTAPATTTPRESQDAIDYVNKLRLANERTIIR